jgi:hypothetical protein
MNGDTYHKSINNLAAHEGFGKQRQHRRLQMAYTSNKMAACKQLLQVIVDGNLRLLLQKDIVAVFKQ